MNREQKDVVIKPLRSYAANIEQIRQALSSIPDSDEARQVLMMARFDILNAIHKISWIGCDKDSAIKEYAIRNNMDDNPSAYEVEDDPFIGQHVDVKA